MLYKKIKNCISLSKFTTWKIGGPAQWIAEPSTISEVIELIEWAENKKINYQTIGAGSNLLINDNGLLGLTICTKKVQGCTIDKTTGVIEALGGEPMPNVARKAAREGLHGLEWAVGIPGTIGGASVMNAGAQGNCTADRLISVKVFSTKTKALYEIKNHELNYSYRSSLLQEEKLIVLSARFSLEPGHNPKSITDLTTNNLNHRLKTQPYHLPSCGSVFRNPTGYKAGQIIENLGLKGLRVGGAEISSIHANFIVNKNKASAKDILLLISTIQEKVKEKHGFLLHTEVKKLGFN
ncbi:MULTISPECIES: UDP-N-acetylmuramate dehydrogenase [unclassified Prochlorococcus]|uniref:UDP-N-acetylmuramate dehydrogenase n=1 Tax=unclassified Prochlorococcus TaxID=2627481 RepID=UPI0005337D13|nr:MULTISPECIES: UDP-N-acetylmuramate dehydrogenase [unclassified Prochlorococcus]KGG16928.1 UDP-N-acetylenolpyruvoylglucosamine reductase [Prochlorococcus sp. MIT 0602]KGG18096.1 UDP-N-acetylenolpyruvoylglucosamine reductase [Prochlorococcus sp. MIT 0603]